MARSPFDKQQSWEPSGIPYDEHKRELTNFHSCLVRLCEAHKYSGDEDARRLYVPRTCNCLRALLMLENHERLLEEKHRGQK